MIVGSWEGFKQLVSELPSNAKYSIMYQKERPAEPVTMIMSIVVSFPSAFTVDWRLNAPIFSKDIKLQFPNVIEVFSQM